MEKANKHINKIYDRLCQYEMQKKHCAEKLISKIH